MQVALRLEVQAGQPLREMLEVLEYPQGGQILFSNANVQVCFKGTLVRKAIDIPQVLQFVVDFATGLEGNLAAAWLVDKIYDKSVERVVVGEEASADISVSNIQRMLEEELRRKS